MPARLLPLLAPVLAGCVTGLGRPAADRPADPDPHDWRTGLGAAVRGGDLPRVRWWLEARPDLLNVESRGTKAPRTPLQQAAESNRVAVADFLIARGADLQGGAGGHWWSPLQLAAYHGHGEVADRLLAAGAPLDLYSAVALDKRDAVERCLGAAAAFGRAGWVANARYAEYTWTDAPLVCVAYARGHADMVALLVRYGADPRAEVIHRPCYISDNRFEGVSAGVTPAGTLYDLP